MSNNPLITVGGVRVNGQYWPNTTPVSPGQAGSITMYAQSVNVTGASNSANAPTDIYAGEGCSFAAPVVVSVLIFLFNDFILLTVNRPVLLLIIGNFNL
jgi:hypothetical protein